MRTPTDTYLATRRGITEVAQSRTWVILMRDTAYFIVIQ